MQMASNLLARLAICAVALALATPVRAREPEEPLAFARNLQSLQDAVARGDGTAVAAQRTAMASLAQRLMEAPASDWADARTLRAAYIYGLSGGDPRVLRKALTHVTKGPPEDILKGILAYTEGRYEVAADLLDEVEARTLDPSVAGPMALVQGVVFAKRDRAKANAYFDDARLLAPGTLVEEAALRRQIALESDGSLAKFTHLVRQYLWRFSRSHYAGAFLPQIARLMAGVKLEGDEARSVAVRDLMRMFPEEQRLAHHLAAAEAALLKGNVALAAVLAREAQALAPPHAPEHQRARLFEAAAQVATVDSTQAMRTLTALDRDGLEEKEIELTKAALSIGHLVHRPARVVAGAEGATEASATEPDGRLRATVAAARQRLSEIDTLLSGAKK